jgi:hypothetical protein
MAVSEAQAVEPPKTKRTTINVSIEFAEALTEVAKDAEQSVADFCDGEYLPGIKPRYADILRRKLDAVEGAERKG